MNSAPSVTTISKRPKGISIIEILVAMTIFVIAAAGITFIVIDALQSSRRENDRLTAHYLTQEAFEAVHSIRNLGWRGLTNGEHGLTRDQGTWELTGTPDTVGSFTRAIQITDVNRNLAGTIVTSGGVKDLDTKKITLRTSRQISPVRTVESTIETYLTNWQSDNWVQTTQTDFSAGTHVNTAVSNTGDGEVLLASSTGTPVGNRFVLDTTAAAFTMTSAQRWTALRFTAHASKSATGIRVYLQTENGVSPTYRYGIQADNNGSPSGTWLGTTQQGYRDWTATTTGWQIITLNESVPLVSGSVYHVIARHQTGTISASRYVTLRSSRPQNLLYPFESTDDPENNILTSTNSGSSWTTTNTQPLYVLQYADATYEGNPYIARTEMSIFGVNQVGETFTLNSPTTVTDIRVSARKNSAQVPAQDLLFSIVSTATGAVVTNGNIVPRASATTAYAWYTHTLPAPVLLASGTYRITFSSPVSVSARSYRIRRVNATNAAQYIAATFGGGASTFVSSVNGGSTWTAIQESDIGGYALGTQGGYALSGEYTSQAFDAGSLTAVPNYLNWTATQAPGTSIEMQARTADTQANLSAAPWVGPDGTSGTRYTVPGDTLGLHPGTAQHQWMQWRAYLTGDGQATPALEHVQLNYE
ncbi:MAG: prepilin-type N-terminal cleavage/methylation domain-containing protein [Patescibacteria group bacterium]|jgi:Tfp pilus assembly protein PilV